MGADVALGCGWDVVVFIAGSGAGGPSVRGDDPATAVEHLLCCRGNSRCGLWGFRDQSLLRPFWNVEAKDVSEL